MIRTESGNVSKLSKINQLLAKSFLLVILLGLIIVFSVLSKNFLTSRNLINILNQNAYLMVAAIGLACLMISGGIDLSLGYLISVVGVCVAIFMLNVGLPIWLSIVLGLLIGCVLGGFNGLISLQLNIHPLLVSLGTMTIFRGLSFTISKSRAFFNLDPAFKFIGQGYIGGFPVALLIVIGVFSVTSFVLSKTYFGRYIYAIGANPETARLAGIPIKKVKFTVFVITGLLASISAIMMISRAGSANSSMGPGTEFDAITACVLGGISFIGGEGKLSGVILAVLILGVLSNGMQLIGLGIYMQFIVKGAILIGALAYDNYQRGGIFKGLKQ